MEMTTRETLMKIMKSPNSSELIKQHSYQGLGEEGIESIQEMGAQYYEGKVRQCITTEDNRLLIVHTDRLTAFDRYIADVPYKGSLLASIATFWFKELEKTFPTHFISQLDNRTLAVKSMTPFKVEVIVRGYLAGSMMRAYNKGGRSFCGVTLKEGLKDYSKLPNAIITPTSKAEAFEHDENRTPDELIAEGVCTSEEWQQIEKMAFDIFAKGQEIYAEKGWILVDTKYEFGKDETGKIYIIDEVHTPDSSRLWIKGTYEEKIEKGLAPEMLDKEIVRRDLLAKGFSGEGDVPKINPEKLIELALVYLEVAEKLTGESLTLNQTDTLTLIVKNL